jgi:hypothetical protein
MVTLRKIESPIQSNYGIYISRQAAEFLFDTIMNNKNKEYLIPSFIAAICCGIEGEINTAYVNFFHKKFGKSYMNFLRPYLFMKLYDRFFQLPIILSNCKYELNLNNQKVKDTLELFEFRNRLLHVKHLWHLADIYEDDNGNIYKIEYHDRNHPDPYRDVDSLAIEATQIKAIMKLYNQFISKFSTITETINRHNFNPDGWFLKTKKT